MGELDSALPNVHFKMKKFENEFILMKFHGNELKKLKFRRFLSFQKFHFLIFF